jgi:2-polyprenyl-6-methoxyphenol hydroxylase-like FAD-dependent oxidoreductase
MVTTERFDAIVVGARVAGAATAMMLARRGWRVLVVERAERGTDTRSTHALMKVGVRQLQRWGLLDELIAAGTPAVTQTTFHYGDESVTIPLIPSDDVPMLLAPRRTVLDPMLADAAMAAGADVRYSTCVTSLVRDADGRVTGIAATDRGGTVDARAPIVIGADGVRSFVAREVGAPTTRRLAHAGAIAYAYFTGRELDGYEWSYRPGVVAGVMPTNGGTLGWVGLPSTRFDAVRRGDVEHGFWTVLRDAAPEIHERLASGRRTSRFHLDAGTPGYLRRCWGPGWALVGDASHYADPLSTHGITAALRDAELVADAVDVGLRDPSTMPDALDRYEARRDELSLPLLLAADELASYRWTMDEVRVHLRTLGRALKDELETFRAWSTTSSFALSPV